MGGVIRDVRSDHPDFGVIPAEGFGQASGNVAYTLGQDGKPVFTGGGYMVTQPWRDASGEPIAPHLYANVGVSVVSIPVQANSSVIDTYDPSLGAYGGTNVGARPGFAVNSAMPTVTAPAGMPPNSGSHRYRNHGTTTISSDIHCSDFAVTQGHTVRINGDIRILCDGPFTVRNQGSLIEFVGNSTLTIYLRDTFNLDNKAVINDDTTQPSRVRIINLGNEPISIDNSTQLVAEVVSPNAPMIVENGADFYGTFQGQTIQSENSSGVHLAAALVDNCGNLIADQAGLEGAYSTAGITSATSFTSWFRSVAGVSAAAWHTVELDPVGGGFYEYSTSAFHPIDDELYGNEGSAHNRYFTFEVSGWFTYRACSDQLIDIQADDDVWIFIDDKLAIDLGGIGAGINQTARLDRLGLSNGQRYKMKLFYAQRQNTRASFSIRTNIAFESFDAEVPLEPSHD
jgi:fibro-slime domain-containing protein